MSRPDSFDRIKLGDFKLPELKGEEDYVKWRLKLQNFMFRTLRNNDMDLLTRTQTLDDDFFSKDEEFTKDYNEAAKSAKKDKHDNVFDYDEDFRDRCFASAQATGIGFKQWVYDLWWAITDCLSDKLAKKLAGVRRGDIIKLLDNIKLAMFQHERFDPTALEIKYKSCTMDGEGNNDLMTFAATLAG